MWLHRFSPSPTARRCTKHAIRRSWHFSTSFGGRSLQPLSAFSTLWWQTGGDSAGHATVCHHKVENESVPA